MSARFTTPRMSLRNAKRMMRRPVLTLRPTLPGAPEAPTVGSPVVVAPTVLAPPAARAGGGLLEAAQRSGLTGDCLSYVDDVENAVVVVPLAGEWTRIGRGLSADVHLEDSTVSRRHALIVNGEDGPRLLDDRSLNGVFLNGVRISSPRALSHGDEIRIGRHALCFARLAPALEAAAQQPPLLVA